MEDSEGEGLGMMLNTDMELYYDIDVDADKGTTTCSIVATDDLPACSRSATADLVDLYATVSSNLSLCMVSYLLLQYCQ